MKSDRELLELAAKAAGYDVSKDAHIPSGGLWISEVISGDFEWNPIANDGDALRLMAKLGLGVVFGQYAPLDIYSVYINEPEGGDTLSVGVIGDGESSCVMRRAIVSAAAEIGESMP